MRVKSWIVLVLAYTATIGYVATATAATPHAPVVPEPSADVARLAKALRVRPDVKPDLVAEAPCSSPGVYREGAKNECIVLDFGKGAGLAMLYYPQLRGNSPKPVKAFTLDDAGIWSEIALPRPVQ
jgi:hypothetical protein